MHRIATPSFPPSLPPSLPPSPPSRTRWQACRIGDSRPGRRLPSCALSSGQRGSRGKEAEAPAGDLGRRRRQSRDRLCPRLWEGRKGGREGKREGGREGRIPCEGLRMSHQCPALHVKRGYFSPSPWPSSASPSPPLRFLVPLPFLSRPSVFFRLEQMWGVMSVKGSSHCFRLPSWKPGGGSEMRVGNEDKDGEYAMGCPHWPIDERQLRATSGSQHSICLPSGSINPRWEPLI